MCDGNTLGAPIQASTTVCDVDKNGPQEQANRCPESRHKDYLRGEDSEFHEFMMKIVTCYQCLSLSLLSACDLSQRVLSADAACHACSNATQHICRRCIRHRLHLHRAHCGAARLLAASAQERDEELQNSSSAHTSEQPRAQIHGKGTRGPALMPPPHLERHLQRRLQLPCFR